MRFLSGLILLVCAGISAAQTSGDPAVAAAEAGVARVRSLVEAGAAPRADLAKAEAALADAQDAAILRRTAYGQDLTVDQAGEMIAAAGRLLDRRQKALDAARRLVDAGVATALSLRPFQEDLDRARQESALVESRARLTRELGEMAQAEEALANHLAQAPSDVSAFGEHYSGDGVFAYATFAKVEVAFEQHFGKPLPVSAVGDTAVHRALGFDHHGRVDVALNPDQPEGLWLCQYLRGNHIPYFAFSHAVPGKATGAHIHIGPMSTKLAAGG